MEVTMKSLGELFKVLSDDTRLRIIHLLYHQDLCVCELVELMDESQPKISKHIAKIRSIDLVKTNRNEQFIYYALNKDNETLMQILTPIIDIVKNQHPFKQDLHLLQNKTSFVCTRN
jgi:ArsR family transcriptional regulator